MVPALSVYVAADCSVCGQSAVGHAQCAGCRIFAGEGHYDTGLVGGLCASCQSRDALTLPTDQEIEGRRKRAQALEVFEERRHIKAVMLAFHLTKHRAERWLRRARRERA